MRKAVGVGEGVACNMYDPGLKQAMLRSVMATQLPHSPSTPNTIPLACLSASLSAIRTHRLLHDPGPAIAHPSSQAFDEWISRLLALLSSTFPENHWVGISFLGITCQECSRQRFLESYSSWFQKLVPHLKPTDVLFVQGATCASLADLITRLGGLVDVTGVRREGTILSGKLIQPVLQLLEEKSSFSIWINAADLLCAVLRNFPSSVKQHFAQVETLLVTKMMKSHCDASLSEKFACCLALLPRAFGDAASWNSLVRRILVAINSVLDDAFAGMEDGSIAKAAAENLVPSGQESTRSLGGLCFSDYSLDGGAAEFWRCLVPRISSLVQCSYFLLVNPYPIQVPVPLGSIISVINRILSVDGSVYKATSSFVNLVPSAKQVALCSELPALHSCALDLMYATLCGVRRQLLPRAGDVVRMLTKYFLLCGSSGLRTKLYEICRQLLNSMGVGMATAIAPTIINNALSDIKDTKDIYLARETRDPVVNASMSAVWSKTINSRKRKDSGILSADFTTACELDMGTGIGEVKSAMTLQVAALQAVEALLTVGGALLADQWRTEIDSAIANIALNASRGIISSSLTTGRSYFSLEAFKLAAYKAFLASLLSPRAHRPPYLSQALSLFQKGRQEAGTEVAEFCAHALLSLEPIIHPRCFSLTTGIITERGLGSENKCDMHDSGVHIDAEGDPVNEIESWIIDYGCDHSTVNEENATTAGTSTIPVTVYQDVDGDQNATTNIFSQDGNLSARQSEMADKEQLNVCVASEDIENALHDNQSTALQVDSVTGDQHSKDSLQGRSKMPNGNVTGASMWTHSSSALPVGSVYASSVQENEGFLLVRPEGAPVSKITSQDEADYNMSENMDVDVVRLRQDFVSLEHLPDLAAVNPTFSEAGQGSSESDSDMIPDIVDADPDTE